MNQASAPDKDGASGRQPSFAEYLRAVSNKIQAAGNIDEIMLDLAQEIRSLFACDRLTVYFVSEDKTALESKLKTGMNSFKDFRLPISESSIAGYVALFKKAVNIRNVYDERELKSYTPRLNFVTKVDKRTGYVTRQMLAAPLVHAQTHELLGVIQLINNRAGDAFSTTVELGVKELAETLAISFAQRLKPAQIIRSKYDPLVANGILSVPEIGLAIRAARRKGLDVQEILVNEFQVKLADIGNSLAIFFGVPYEPYRQQRNMIPAAPNHLSRALIDDNHWLPLEENAGKLIVLATDPQQVKASRIVSDFFPNSEINYRVTTNREFSQTADLLFGALDGATAAGESDAAFDPHAVAAAESALVNRINTVIIDAFRNQKYADITITLRPGANQTASRFHKDGSLESIRGSVTVDFQVGFSAKGDAGADC